MTDEQVTSDEIVCDTRVTESWRNSLNCLQEFNTELFENFIQYDTSIHRDCQWHLMLHNVPKLLHFFTFASKKVKRKYE
jgi:hypothetical protein